MPGNLEPEAFSPDGGFVYVLDHLPPAAPDRYRVRQLEVATGRLLPLNTRLKTPVPAGAEEEMRGEGRQAVYDAGRQLLFTLYTHQPDHVHTRDLIHGARADAPHVHAFVHTLDLTVGWAYCVDLPAPFGEKSPTGHAIALAPDAGALAVVDATTGTLATIDPGSLEVTATTRFATPPPSDAPAALAYGRPSELAVARDAKVVVLDPGTGAPVATWTAPAPVRGMSIVDGTAFLGGDGAVTTHHLATGAQLTRIEIPSLTRLIHVLPPR
ncbi:NHL repeat-containing protein [Rhizomonospora bruguierae]|uniref:hypothetical protein n=1 Tax=Rhizomonospora bruguierae TaxID=1581705 RepID=UPI001BCAC57D|nr:hypothetical protein [Micromonospora sp. NBRC 107566]